MKKRNLAIGIVMLAVVLGVSGSALAHHGTGLYYTNGTALTLKGTVTEFEFVNPHSQIYFDVKDDKGAVVHWGAECVSPGKLARAGFTRDTLKPGDEITITVHPAKSGEPIGSFVKLVMADGKELPLKDAQ